MEEKRSPVTEKVENIGLSEEAARERYARRKLAEREKKQKEKNSEKKRKRNKNAGFIAAIVALSAVTLVLGSLLIAFELDPDDSAEARYIQSEFYNLADNVGGVDENLNKLIVSYDRTSQQRYLGEVTVKALLAADSVAALPIHDESKFNTIAFENKVSDYAKYLNDQLIDGFTITSDDYANLKKIRDANAALKNDLAELSGEMNGKFDIKSLKSGDKSNVVLKRFSDIEARSESYPKLIYDGPFSDALAERDPKALGDENVTLAEAKDIFGGIFGKDGLKNVEEAGETQDVIKTFNFKARVSDDVEVFARISERGGKLVAFNYYANCTEETYDLEACKKIGEDFLAALGIENMKVVWATEKGANAYMNFAYETDGVIVYKDMIKMTVCKERGLVSAYDAREYYLNHVQRDIPAPKLTESEAAGKLSRDMAVESVRLALIPKGEEKEILAYEFAGRFDDSVYYIYVDAATGKQAQVFKVVDTDQGTLLI